jgi:hypothetical protein
VEPVKEQVPNSKPEVTEKPSSSSTPKPEKLEARGRSHSPPRGPRGSQWRKISKSPPKGPRNHTSSTPSNMSAPVPPPVPISAPAPMYPTGPRADRRPKDLSDQPPLRSSEFTKIQPPTSERWTRGVTHPKAGRYGITQLELDVSTAIRLSIIQFSLELAQSSSDIDPTASTSIKCMIKCLVLLAAHYTNWTWRLLIYVWRRLGEESLTHKWRRLTLECWE